MAKKKPTDSEVEDEATNTEPPPTSASATSYDGQKIKKAREAKGLTHEDISASTKISMKILRALEDERYEDMPNARVYVRGFVRCVAKEIGLDQDQVSQSYIPRWEAWREQLAES